MVTVISRPLGHKLTDQELNATVYNSSQEALFLTEFAHGLQTGDYVYVQSNIASYNGYKYVVSVAYNEFKIRESEEGSYIQYKQTVDATYRISVLSHGYLAISQPIVYELESDLYPVPSSEQYYNTRVIDSTEDAQGYTQLNLSEPLTDPQELDFIQLVGTGSLAGSYQILTVLQPWSVIINLAYDASNIFLGYEVLKYYNNYVINVQIWAGLDTDHVWEEEKPYENLATLKLRPDDNGRVKFSISDILRGHIHTRNKLDLDTLPNNLDFWTGFYIKYYESYDQSDGEEVTTLEGGLFSDKIFFEGHAINADMPFKSVYQSHMSDYINEDTYLAQWLLLQATPVVVIGYFFDMSFLNTQDRELIVYKNGVPESLGSPGVGVIRVPIEPEETGQLCVSVYGAAYEQQDTEVITDDFDLSTWLNDDQGLTDWTTGIANPTVNIVGLNSEFLYTPYATVAGQVYNYQYEFSASGTGVGTKTYQLLFLDAGFLAVGFSFIPITGDGNYSGSVDITPSSNGTYIALKVSSIAVPMFITAIRVSTSHTETTTVELPEQQLTEEICLTVLEECDDTLIPDDIRLTEDGDYRVLE